MTSSTNDVTGYFQARIKYLVGPVFVGGPIVAYA